MNNDEIIERLEAELLEKRSIIETLHSTLSFVSSKMLDLEKALKERSPYVADEKEIETEAPKIRKYILEKYPYFHPKASLLNLISNLLTKAESGEREILRLNECIESLSKRNTKL